MTEIAAHSPSPPAKGGEAFFVVESAVKSRVESALRHANYTLQPDGPCRLSTLTNEVLRCVGQTLALRDILQVRLTGKKGKSIAAAMLSARHANEGADNLLPLFVGEPHRRGFTHIRPTGELTLTQGLLFDFLLRCDHIEQQRIRVKHWQQLLFGLSKAPRLKTVSLAINLGVWADINRRMEQGGTDVVITRRLFWRLDEFAIRLPGDPRWDLFDEQLNLFGRDLVLDRGRRLLWSLDDPSAQKVLSLARGMEGLCEVEMAEGYRPPRAWLQNPALQGIIAHSGIDNRLLYLAIGLLVDKPSMARLQLRFWWPSIFSLSQQYSLDVLRQLAERANGWGEKKLCFAIVSQPKRASLRLEFARRKEAIARACAPLDVEFGSLLRGEHQTQNIEPTLFLERPEGGQLIWHCYTVARRT